MDTTKRRKAFGQQLDALLTLSDLNHQDVDLVALGESFISSYISISDISPGKYQPRKNFDTTALHELSESIKVHGIIQPLIVRKVEKGYEIIAGERRWRAAKLAGLSQVPVLIREVDDQTALAFGLIENIQRKDLNPIEEAYSFKRLLSEFSLTHEEVAKAVGRSRATISNTLRLLELSDVVKKMLEQGRIQMGHARAMLTLPDDLQCQAAALAELKQLSVRATEVLVKRFGRPKANAENRIEDSSVSELQSHLEERLPGHIIIQMKKGGGGQMVFKFDNLGDFEYAAKVLLGLSLCRGQEDI